MESCILRDVSCRFFNMLVPRVTAVFFLFIAASWANLENVDPKLWRSLEAKRSANIFVTMKSQPDLSDIRRRHFGHRGERAKAVRDSLITYAENSQKSVLGAIRSRRPSYASSFRTRGFWITNQVYVQDADYELVQELRNHPDVDRIEEEEIVHLDDEPIMERQASWGGSGVLANQWGVEKVQAPTVWTMAGGITGTGITVGIVDSGARVSHEILRKSYRNDGYSWFDTLAGSEEPRDDRGHGTHVTGSIVGSNGYGVAPGAKWMSCKAFDANGSAPTSLIIRCFEFMICPTNPNGTSTDCNKAPHMINNSWSTSASSPVLDAAVSRLHTAGIIPIFSNGNYGENGCGSVRFPSDQNTINVGATSIADGLGVFSSRGPNLLGSIKPDFSAPGVNVTSALNGSDAAYGTASGTSMSAPHATGVVALLLSYKPSLDFYSIRDILQRSSDKSLSFSNEICGNIRDSVFPNNHFGHGRINAYAAVLIAANYQPPSTTTTRSSSPRSGGTDLVMTCILFQLTVVLFLKLFHH